MSLINGVVPGVVTAVDRTDAPGSLVEEGRVKVTFRWLDEGHETDWVRIAWPMAGPGKGMMFMPKVEDEVLLAFEHGDVRTPYVIGCLWNGQDQPPSDHVQKRIIKTERNHQIIFLDAEEIAGSKGALVIKDGHGNIISLSNGKIIIQSVGVLEIEANAISFQGRRAPGQKEPPWRRNVTPNNNPI